MTISEIWLGAPEPAPLVVGTPIALGRADADGVVGLDPDDMGISSQQCVISDDGTSITLRNVSSTRPVSIEYLAEVLHHRIPPGATHTFTGPALVLVSGVIRTHPIGVRPREGYAPHLRAAPGDTVVGAVSRSDLDMEALAALFVGYLRRWPRHRPEPLSYEEAAALLSDEVNAATVRKRVERVRERLNASGLVALEGRNALWDLATHLIESGQIHPSDLGAIGETVQWKGPSTD